MTPQNLYNVWTDPLTLMFFGFCGVYIVTTCKKLLEIIIQEKTKEIRERKLYNNQ